MQPNGPWSPPPGGFPNNYAQPGPFGPVAHPYGGPGMGYRENFFIPPGAAAGPLPGTWLRTAKLVTGIAQVLSMVFGLGLIGVGAAMGEDGAPVAIAGTIGLGFWYLLVFAYAIMNAVWVYQFWCWIPPEHRHTSMWKKYISPGMAIGFMFVPYFNLYWLFVIYLGIAEVLERMRVQYPTNKPPAKSMALISVIVSFVFFPAAPIVQFLFARHVEGMATDMQARRPIG